MANKYEQITSYIKSNYNLRFNTISHEIEKEVSKRWETLNENDLLCELMEKDISSPRPVVEAYLGSSYIEKHDPIEDYLKGLEQSAGEWTDKENDYIHELAQYVEVPPNIRTWFDTQFKKMLVRSLACSLKKIPFNKQCFTLRGKQNDGKTTFLRFLCPPDLRKYFKENLDFLSKDGKISLCQNFFINLEELADLPKGDLKKTKAILTVDMVKERLPYGKRPINIPRIANFLASTNESEFLTDETGNVRWLVFPINGIKHDNGGKNGYNKNVNIDNVYRQAYKLLKSGFNHQLTRAEIAKSESINKKFMKLPFEYDLLAKFFRKPQENEQSEFYTNDKIISAIEMETKQKINPSMIKKSFAIMDIPQTSEYVKKYRNTRRGYKLIRLETLFTKD